MAFIGGIGLAGCAIFARRCLPSSIWHLLGGVGVGSERSIC